MFEEVSNQIEGVLTFVKFVVEIYADNLNILIATLFIKMIYSKGSDVLLLYLENLHEN